MKRKFCQVCILCLIIPIDAQFEYNPSASSSALYSVGLVTALCTGEKERCCIVTQCESVSKALN